MFNAYEALVCSVCKKSFTGRKPADGGIIYCPECLSEQPIVNEGDKIPDSVKSEMEEGVVVNG